MENYELVTKALDYIEKNKTESTLNIEDVAKNIGFSTDYFNRVFRNHTGYNVMEYVRFRRLVYAAMQLRKGDRNIVDIGLACGYDSHDGFGRAFKNQYGKTPSEYREMFKEEPLKFTDLKLNEVTGQRIAHMLPSFNIVPTDIAIDYLLKTDAKRFGYDAVTMEVNGTVVLSEGDIDTDGCFIGADMFPSGYRYFYVHVKKVSDLRFFVECLMKLSPKVIQVAVEEVTDREEIKRVLDGIAYKNLDTMPQAMYFDDEVSLPQGSEKYEFRVLKENDIDDVVAWAKEMNIDNGRWDWGLKQALSIPFEKRVDNQPFGMFDGGRLIGVSRLGIQETRGFRINNCIYCMFLPQYASDEMYRILYANSLNYILTQNCIPFDDEQFGEWAEKNGNFTALDMGYEQTNTVYIISV